MKKTVLLSVICIMICFALCACGTNVKVEELNLKGESVSLTEAIDFLNEKEENAKNETTQEQWYSLSGALSVYSRYENDTLTEESDVNCSITGKFFQTEDEYEVKLKLDIKGSGTNKKIYDRTNKYNRNRDDQYSDVSIECSMIYVHGRFYVKVVSHEVNKTEGKETTETEYISTSLKTLLKKINLPNLNLDDIDIDSTDIEMLIDLFKNIKKVSYQLNDLDCRLDTKSGYVALSYGTFNDDTYSSIATKTKTQLSTNFKKGSKAINKAEIYTFASTENLSFTTPSLSKVGICMAIKTSMGTVIKEPSDIYKYSSL